METIDHSVVELHGRQVDVDLAFIENPPDVLQLVGSRLVADPGPIDRQVALDAVKVGGVASEDGQ